MFIDIPRFDGRCEMTPDGADEVFEAVLVQRKTVIELGRRICNSCQIQTACREYAIQTGQPYGMWGGLTASEIQREALRRNGGDAA